MSKKETEYEFPKETNPHNAEIGNKTMDKMLNTMWMRSGNVLNEQKRAQGAGGKRNLLFVFIALLFLAAILAFIFFMPQIGQGLKWLVSHI